MSESKNNVIAVRVKEEPKKTSYVTMIVGAVLSLFISLGSLMLYFLDGVDAFLYIGLIFLPLGVFFAIFIPISLKNYKRILQELNYPLEAIKLVGNAIEIITDKTERVRFDEIKKVFGTNISTTVSYGFFMRTTTYNYGPMAIHLKDGRKINLYNIDNVNQVVKVLDYYKK